MIQQPLKEKIYSLEVKVVELQAENEHLIGVVESTRQDYDDLLDGSAEAKLQAVNERLREALIQARFENDYRTRVALCTEALKG